MNCFESIFSDEDTFSFQAYMSYKTQCFMGYKTQCCVFYNTYLSLCCPLISPVKDIFNFNERFTFTNKG